jgi:amino acid transporter
MVLASALLVTLSLGPMAEALGNVSALVWIGIALVGAAQCALLAEMSSCFPSRAGGTPQYAYRATAGGSPLLGALSSWGYWLAWTPGIAVSLLLAAEYLTAAVGLGVAPVPFAAVLGLALYGLTALGLRLAIVAAALAGVVALVPLVVILATPVFSPGSFDVGSVVALSLPGPPKGTTEVVVLIAQWSFVAAWSAYGAEMASTLVGEVREATRVMPRVMAVSAASTVLAFTVVPIVMIGLVTAPGLAGEPAAPFLGPAGVVFGDAGRTVVGIMFAAALILTAETFIIASSRTIYQIARDRHLPAWFARVSRRGVPIGSIAWDALVIGVMLAVFGADVVEIVAAANVGYLVVFVLLPVAYVRLRAQVPERPGALRLGRGAQVLAWALAVFNALLLLVGGTQWGARVMVTGTALVLLIVPVSYASRRWWNRDTERVRLQPARISPPTP